MRKEKTVKCELDREHPNWFLTAKALREKGLLQMGQVTEKDDVRKAGKWTLIHCKGKKGFSVRGRVFKEPIQCERSYRAYWPLQSRSKCPYCGAYNHNPQ